MKALCQAGGRDVTDESQVGALDGGAEGQKPAAPTTRRTRCETGADGQRFGSGVQTTERGFTNHEQVDDLETAHMNARVFDPTAGRFLQPDPLVQDVYRPQNWNPYAYAWNNPLRYTDPTGMFNVGRFLRTVASIAITIWLPGSSAIFGSLANSWFSAAVSGFFAGGVGSGSLRGGLVGAFSAGLFSRVGTYFKGAEWAKATSGTGVFNTGLSAAGFGGKIAAHGMAGGVMSHLQGGKFGAGFASAGFAQAFSPMIGGASTHAGKVIASAFVGGTASVISGGKFANGAVTAAFSYAFGEMARRGAGEARSPSATTEYPLSDEGPHVTMVCRPTWGIGAHCGTFVWSGVEPSADGIVQQFSLRGFATSFDDPASPSDTFRTDTAAFLNPGGRNQHFLIAPPGGVSQSQFANNVRASGNQYGRQGGTMVPGYRIFAGPNSNSAAAFPILDAGGAIPSVWNAPAMRYWERRP